MEVILAEKRKGPSEMSRGVISSEATEVMSSMAQGDHFTPAIYPQKGLHCTAIRRSSKHRIIGQVAAQKMTDFNYM